MALYLSCGLCGRKQADGLLSRGHWGHLDVADGNTLRACPTCKGQHTDWEQRLQAVVAGVGPSYGAAYGSQPAS
jgi:hypothetical protein